MSDDPLLTPEDKPLLTPEEEGDAKVSRNGNGKRPREEKVDVPPATQSALPTPSPFLGGASPSAEKYRKLDKVGVGAYGSVFMAENSETKEIVAIKQACRKEDPMLGGFPVSLLREISILMSLQTPHQHENIVKLFEVAHTPQGDPLMVMEFCQASLLELIHSTKHDLSFSEVKYIIRQILDATRHIHDRGILHRDLATKNVLFNLSGEIKVCDFGISRVAFGQDERLGFLPAKDLEDPNMIVSLPYRAIELLLGDRKYGPALDIWSVGSILAEIILCQSGRRQPFFGGSSDNPNKSPVMMVEEIFTILGRPTEDSWPGLCKLPFFRPYSTAKVSSAKAHRAKGDEMVHLRKWFGTSEGKPASTKYNLTESFFDLLGNLLILNPADRASATDALKHPSFKEKPVPEWHAWHWALASAEIPRGDRMRQQGGDEHEKKKMLRQLAKPDVQPGEEGVKPNSKGTMVERWKLEAEKKKQAEALRAEKIKAAQEKQKALQAQAQEKRDAQARAQAKAQDQDRKAQSTAGAEEKLPPGWTKHWSASKQRHFYHESKTGKNVWVCPK